MAVPLRLTCSADATAGGSPDDRQKHIQIAGLVNVLAARAVLG